MQSSPEQSPLQLTPSQHLSSARINRAAWQLFDAAQAGRPRAVLDLTRGAPVVVDVPADLGPLRPPRSESPELSEERAWQACWNLARVLVHEQRLVDATRRAVA